jgi:lipid-A-disaccharide synthase-like uncharacterized protein
MIIYWLLNTVVVFAIMLQSWLIILLDLWMQILTFVSILLMLNLFSAFIYWIFHRIIPLRIEKEHENGIRLFDVLLYFLLLLYFESEFITNIPLEFISIEFFSILGICSAIGFFIQPQLTEDRAESLESAGNNLIASWPVVSASWLIVGFGGGWAFLDAIARIISYVTDPSASYTSNPLLLWTGAISGTALMLISLLNRKKRISLINPHVTAYVSAMELLDVSDSAFLGTLQSKGEPKHTHFDHDEAMRRIEEVVPWVFGLISVTLWFGTSNVTLNDITSRMVFFFLIFFTAIVIAGLAKRIREYSNWRKTWIGCWNLLGLLALSDSILSIQFMFILSQDDDFVLHDEEKEMKKYTKDFYKNQKIKKDIPTSDTDLIHLYTNVVLFELLKKRIKKPSKKMKEILKTVDLLSIARGFNLKAEDLDDKDVRRFLIRALFFATIGDLFDVPTEMLTDASGLFVSTQTGKKELLSLCETQISSIKEMPHHSVPESVKWLPVIYSFAIWLTTALDALFDLSALF